MHQFNIVAAGDFKRVLLDACNSCWLDQQSSQGQYGAAEKFSSGGCDNFDAEVPGMLQFAIERRVVNQAFVHSCLKMRQPPLSDPPPCEEMGEGRNQRWNRV